jgi:hypothetical protein
MAVEPRDRKTDRLSGASINAMRELQLNRLIRHAADCVKAVVRPDGATAHQVISEWELLEGGTGGIALPTPPVHAEGWNCTTRTIPSLNQIPNKNCSLELHLSAKELRRRQLHRSLVTHSCMPAPGNSGVTVASSKS